MDRLVLDWSARLESLLDELHPLLRSYVSLDGTRSVAPKALAPLIAAHRWTRYGPGERDEAQPFNDFVRLVTGDADALERWAPRIQEALTRVATSSYHEAPTAPVQHFMAIRMPGLPPDFRIMAEISTIFTELVPREGPPSIASAAFDVRVEVPGRTPVVLPIEWKAYSFLRSVAEGYAPRPSDPFVETFVGLLSRRLSLTSAMEKEISVHQRERNAVLRLRASPKAKDRHTIKAEVRS